MSGHIFENYVGTKRIHNLCNFPLTFMVRVEVMLVCWFKAQPAMVYWNLEGKEVNILPTLTRVHSLVFPFPRV